ncbi:GNAT family N-acetyltransferase [Paenibacillus sp. BSR1-1]|uniref:GNAT family N-acetyltransferase n=1 Tax=Paenibacillus sp. BSR1-1 TaxID=3020845 RepID=UPI0025AF3F14|nr:GNAT family N-acetyltransferase [Paenibacillus sp. BSR1-1]MDN3018308.1 GNAT family N-acetyltransferase [Paenibacillus sp. BSR1-1]
MLVREAQPEDAENLIKLIKQVEAESDFMLMETGERKTSPEQQRKRLVQMRKDNNSVILVAEQEDGKLAGYLIAIGGTAKRNKHTVYLVIGILQEYRGRGIGTKLFQRIEAWALTHKISRMELTVVTENLAGVTLYKKMGFEIEGTKRNSLFIQGTYFDEYYMSRIL